MSDPPWPSAARRQLFLSLPVRDVRASMRFFAALGFRFEPRFTDSRAACMRVGADACVMLLLESFFQAFTPRRPCDTTARSELWVRLDCRRRVEVDELCARALAAGGSRTPPLDQLFMYSASFFDLDGHRWQPCWRHPHAAEA